MDALFDEIAAKCSRKQVASLCKKLNKKLSFKSGSDVNNLYELAYWLYILGEIDFAKKCIALTHGVPFNQDYRVWDFIHNMWGLEIRILRDEGKNDKADEIAKTMDEHSLMPVAKYNETAEHAVQSEKKRRARFGLGVEYEWDVSWSEKIEENLKEGNIRRANEWRFSALPDLIGKTATDLYPNLNRDKDKIEALTQNYIAEILKGK